MTLGTTIWLWLGLALLIPLLIHLWNKKSGRPRLLGTFRFLPEESYASAKRIELHEIPLMLIRMLLVMLVVLLIAGLFWDEEAERVGHLIVAENPGMEQPQTEADGDLIYTVSSEEIDRKGWWNILEQIEYEDQPERVTVRGEFTEERFKGTRPRLNMNINWQAVDSLQTEQKILAAWQLNEGEYRRLIHQRTEAGVEIFIEDSPLSTIDDEEIKIIEIPRLLIHSQNEEEIKNGLRYAAERWGIEWTEQPLAETARLVSGEESTSIIQNTDTNGVTARVGVNQHFGVLFSVMKMGAADSHEKVIVSSIEQDLPFLYTDEEGDLVINGRVQKELESWIFAGVGYQLISEAFGIVDKLSPEMMLSQRNIERMTSEENIPDPKQQRSASLWLVGLLAVCWLTERWMAPGRGM